MNKNHSMSVLYYFYLMNMVDVSISKQLYFKVKNLSMNREIIKPFFNGFIIYFL